MKRLARAVANRTRVVFVVEALLIYLDAAAAVRLLDACRGAPCAAVSLCFADRLAIDGVDDAAAARRVAAPRGEPPPLTPDRCGAERALTAEALDAQLLIDLLADATAAVRAARGPAPRGRPRRAAPASRRGRGIAAVVLTKKNRRKRTPPARALARSLSDRPLAHTQSLSH